MRLSDMKDSFKDFWTEFKKDKSGVVGLILFLFFIFIVLFEPMLLPFPEANKRWRDISYWEDFPKAAPPAWTNWFTPEDEAKTTILTEFEQEKKDLGQMELVSYTVDYDYQFDTAPNDMIFHVNARGKMIIQIELTRPDGKTVEIYQAPMNTGRSEGKGVRISIDNSSRGIAFNFAKDYESAENLDMIKEGLIKTTDAFFAKAEPGMIRYPEPLKGEYQIKFTGILQTEDAHFEDPRIVMPGKVWGVLGTDSYKRDIWTGVLAGVKWALLIGIMTAVFSVTIGVIYGVISAYLGGWRDALMQRIFEVFVSVPLLPVLIVLSAVFEPSIWTMVIMMSAFFWTGSVKTVRSMALQIKEETYIEASQALGASNFRIIFKHMVPLLIPYSFSAMALFIPRAVVYEASISLLGLGDATIVTWGQILSDALNSGAVLNGLWWWVVPPGLSIALMGMAFAFLGFAMDKILHPKLRTR